MFASSLLELDKLISSRSNTGYDCAICADGRKTEPKTIETNAATIAPSPTSKIRASAGAKGDARCAAAENTMIPAISAARSSRRSTPSNPKGATSRINKTGSGMPAPRANAANRPNNAPDNVPSNRYAASLKAPLAVIRATMAAVMTDQNGSARCSHEAMTKERNVASTIASTCQSSVL